MDRETALFLNLMTCEFYRDNAASFSATRRAPWDGWQPLAGTLHEAWDTEKDKARTVADLACGNLRFERFLAEEFPSTPFVFRTWDNCDPLVGDVDESPMADVAVNHHRADIVSDLLASDPIAINPESSAAGCDLATCFGFFHHIPTAKAREHALAWLLGSVRPGGIVALSLWRFADDDRARAKAEQATEHALANLSNAHPGLANQLAQGDYLLGWQETRSSFRYCHSFEDKEVSRLIELTANPVGDARKAGGAARLLDRYRADGKNGRSNDYLVFRKEAAHE